MPSPRALVQSLYLEQLALQLTKNQEHVAAFGFVLAAVFLTYWNVLVELVRAWSTDDNYSHGFFIVPLALYFAWERRKALAAAPFRASWFGVVIVAGSLGLLVAGLLGVELFLTRVSIIGTLTGAILFLFGWQVLRLVAFPLAF